MKYNSHKQLTSLVLTVTIILAVTTEPLLKSAPQPRLMTLATVTASYYIMNQVTNVQYVRLSLLFDFLSFTLDKIQCF